MARFLECVIADMNLMFVNGIVAAIRYIHIMIRISIKNAFEFESRATDIALR